MRFEVISETQWVKDCVSCGIGEEYAKTVYPNIRIPQRATTTSAGYDFYVPFNNLFIKENYLLVPTGIRWVGEDTNQVLLLCPRSGQGFKYGLHLRNTIGVIDSDYQFASNEGHIMAKLAAEEPFTLKQGQAFMQGIMLPFAVADNEQGTNTVRIGGFGSTDEVK